MLQTKYDAYSSAGKLVGYTIIGIGSLYVISLLDAVIFGKQYPKMAVSTGRESTGQLLAIMVPELSNTGHEGYYAEVRYEKKF
jgi:hypothetical protein